MTSVEARESSRYIRELDGLRAISILLVLSAHFYGGPGGVGVDLFFVISGFLITGICLDHRGPGFWRAFYGRRALRILPPYFAVLGIASAISVVFVGRWPRDLASMLTFTTNIAIFRRGTWEAYLGYGHLWSVAVEEQFYLLWPMFAMRLSPKSVMRLAIATIPVALILRCVLIANPATLTGASVLMPARMDTLAIGAMLAVVWRSGVMSLNEAAAPRRWVSAVPIVVWIAAAAVWLIAIDRDWGVFGADWPTAGYSVVAIGCGALIACVLIADPSSPLRRWLRIAPLQSIGRLSYAIYLIHIPLYALASDLGIVHQRFGGLLALLGWTATSYLLAALSWRFVEAPALRLKSRFPYHVTPVARDAAIAGAVAS